MKKKIVFVAGKTSHDVGEHEHNAACLLLSHYLNENLDTVEAIVHRDGWPQDSTALYSADAIVIYGDGGEGNVVYKHLEQMDDLMKKGVGLVVLHYAVEMPKGAAGDYFLDWIGGYFELNWSVNPRWVPDFEPFPEHPITRGVNKFSVKDEWYFHMRFRANMTGIIPIISAVAPDSTMERPDSPWHGNPHARKSVANRELQHLMWAVERENGGRGVGFTGGHWHTNWANDDFRKIVLNAILWAAKGDVPENGVSSETPTKKELDVGQG